MSKRIELIPHQDDIQMESKHMKRCSTSYVIRELEIKTTLIYHYISIKMARIQNTDNPDRWWGCGAVGTLIHCWWECKMVQPLWKTVCQFLTKRNILLVYNSAVIPPPGIYPKELKTYLHTETCTRVFIAALFIIVKIQKPPRCPSSWLDK